MSNFPHHFEDYDDGESIYKIVVCDTCHPTASADVWLDPLSKIQHSETCQLTRELSALRAETEALATGLRLAHEQMLMAGMGSDEIDRTCGLDACTRALEERDREVVRPLVEETTKLRKIAAHVPGLVWIAAKEAAGFGDKVKANED